MLFKPALLLLATASAVLVLGAPALSQTAQAGAAVKAPASTAAGKLVSQYSTFAGSTSNAEALITGLRDDTSITLLASPDGLNPTAPPATFTPATGKVGYGNINIALSLAMADLAKQGITEPTPDQLAAALNGGTISTATGTATLAGVLAQRQAGLGWGQIAQAMGVKLGSLVSASKTAKAGAKATKAVRVEASGKAQEAGGKGSQAQNAGNSGSGGNSGGSNGGGGGGGKK